MSIDLRDDRQLSGLKARIASEPLVSICVSVYNEEKFLAETLESVANQGYRHFEVLIFDNASTDQTAQVCSLYASRDSRFRVYRHKINIGQVNNIGRCFVPAVGDLVLILSGNDVLAPTYLEKVVERHASDASIGLVFTRSSRIDDRSNVVERLQDHHYFSTDARDPLAAYETVMREFRDPGAFFATYKRALLERLQPLRHSYGSDQIFVSESSLYGHISFVDEYLFFSRVHSRTPLPRVFSEYHAREQPDQSLFALLDILTPMISHVWAHLDMIAKAQVTPGLKSGLADIMREICMYRSGRRIRKEREDLIRYVKQSQVRIKRREQNLTMRTATVRLLQSIQRAMLVLPDCAELWELSVELTNYLSPRPPR